VLATRPFGSRIGTITLVELHGRRTGRLGGAAASGGPARRVLTG
jgi:hypothetical protein